MCGLRRLLHRSLNGPGGPAGLLNGLGGLLHRLRRLLYGL